MAGLVVDGDELVVGLGWWERVVTRRRELRVPLHAVTAVVLQPDRWRALRGVRESGLAVPGALCLGVWRHKDGRDFVALRGHRRTVLCVDLRPPAEFARIAVDTDDADRGVMGPYGVETDDPVRTLAALCAGRERAAGA